MPGKSKGQTIPCKGWGLAKVMTMTSTGIKEHHHSEKSIEEACLTKAKAWFTQANDMAFLTEPLILELGIISKHKEQFDQITDRTYLPPPQKHQTMSNNFYHSCNAPQ